MIVIRHGVCKMRKLICICILTAVFLSALTGCGNKVVDNDIEKPNEEDVRSLIDYKDSPNIWGDVYDITDFGGKMTMRRTTTRQSLMRFHMWQPMEEEQSIFLQERIWSNNQ